MVSVDQENRCAVFLRAASSFIVDRIDLAIGVDNLLWRTSRLIRRTRSLLFGPTAGPAEELHGLLTTIVIDLEVLPCQVGDRMSLLIEGPYTHIYEPARYPQSKTCALRPDCG